MQILMFYVSVFLKPSEGENSAHFIELDQRLTTHIQRKCIEPRVVSTSVFYEQEDVPVFDI